MLLAIDTSTRHGGVLLWNEGRMVSSYSWYSRRNHTAVLLPAVEHLLRWADVQMRDLSCVALCIGPGGFSALRVGMSVSKGLCLALDLPLVAVSTLEMEAYPHAHIEKPICPLIEISRQEVAWAQFQRSQDGWHKIRPEEATSLERFAQSVPGGSLLCGEGIVAHSAFLKATLGSKVTIAEYPGPALRLSALARLGAARLELNVTHDPANLQPLYLRQPTITKANPPRRVSP